MENSLANNASFLFYSVLIGVGLLSLPMGFKYAGWVCGMATLFLAATVTAYTAKLLAKCMDLDPSLITFSDLAFISFGRNARIATSILFTLELLAACVALIVLFADSLDLLFPGFLSVNGWKIVCSIILIPLNFLPLRLLSFTSIIGIFCCFSSKCHPFYSSGSLCRFSYTSRGLGHFRVKRDNELIAVQHHSSRAYFDN